MRGYRRILKLNGLDGVRTPNCPTYRESSIYSRPPFYLLFIQGVSGGIVNILGGVSMDYSE